MITIFLNGEPRDVESNIDLETLLDKFSLPKQRVAVELNKAVVRKSDWPTTNISESDRIEVVHFVGGG